MSGRCGLLPHASVFAAAFLMLPAVAAGQSRYVKSDVGHPVRVGDAYAAERGDLHVHLPEARFERFDAGIGRWRFEPGLSLGILARTAIEIRSTFVYREAGASPRGGLSGAGLSIFQSMLAQGARHPAASLEADVFAPIGNAASGGAALTVRALTSWDVRFVRVHANVQYGSFAVDIAPSLPPCKLSDIVLGIPCSGNGPKAPPDVPCTPPVPGFVVDRALGTCATAAALNAVSVAAENVRLDGRRWLVGLALDRDLARQHLLLMADIYVERFVGLLDKPDWTVESGFRKQVTEGAGIEAAVGRRLSGASRSWTVSAGVYADMRAGRQRRRQQ